VIANRSHCEPQTLMLATADRCDPTDRDQLRSAVRAGITLARYGTAWPIFITREMLAACDDWLAFMMSMILGDDWQAVGFDEGRRSGRRLSG
jgi:hypothetical protein